MLHHRHALTQRAGTQRAGTEHLCVRHAWREQCDGSIFGAEQPAALGAEQPAALTGRLHFHPWGRVSNCLMLLERGRQVAELLGKEIVVPACRGVRTYYTHVAPQNTSFWCRENSARCRKREWADPNAFYTAASMRGCRREAPPPPLPVPAAPAPSNVTCIEFKAWTACPGRCPANEAGGPANGTALSCGEPLATWCKDAKHSGCCNPQHQRDLPAGSRITSIVEVYSPSASDSGWVEPLRRIAGDVLVLFGDTFFLEWERMFHVCAQPEATAESAALTAKLHAKLVARGLAQTGYACVHWRAGDLISYGSTRYPMARPETAAARLMEALARHSVPARSVLVLTEPTNKMLSRFRDVLRDDHGLAVVSPPQVYAEEPHAYAGSVINFDATFAEKELCSLAALFIGDNRSSFSTHIEGMVRARSPSTPVEWATSGSDYGDTNETWQHHSCRGGTAWNL